LGEDNSWKKEKMNQLPPPAAAERAADDRGYEPLPDGNKKRRQGGKEKKESPRCYPSARLSDERGNVGRQPP